MNHQQLEWCELAVLLYRPGRVEEELQVVVKHFHVSLFSRLLYNRKFSPDSCHAIYTIFPEDNIHINRIEK